MATRTCNCSDMYHTCGQDCLGSLKRSNRTPKDEYPRILVISSNPFSKVGNNGKTLSSFFKGYPQGKVAQLYFSDELPNTDCCTEFFKVSDHDVLSSVLSPRGRQCGGQIHSCIASECLEGTQMPFSIDIIKKSNLARLLRELMWSTGVWHGVHLSEWLDSVSPDIVFLCGGDGGFAYDISQYVQERYDAKLILFITDDYIMPRRFASPFFWLRRRYVLKKMQNAIDRCSLFITISEKMRREYSVRFGKDSIVMMNMASSMKDKSKCRDDTDCIDLIYTGGLHYNRFRTLNLLARSLRRYNDHTDNRTRAFLRIYSTHYPNARIRKYLDVEGASRYCGSLDPSELREALNSSDILVHVESFDRKSIEATRLSISTKIPEYLSLGKPILAIGPQNIASMEYLEDCSFCITGKDAIYPQLKRLLDDSTLREQLSLLACEKYEVNHNSDAALRAFRLKLLQLCQR